MIWTEAEDKYLIDNYLLLNRYDIAIKLNRTTEAVRKRMQRFNLNSKMNSWSTTDVNKLIDLYGKTSCGDIYVAIQKRHSLKSIYSKIEELGLKNGYFTQYYVNHDYFAIPNLENSYIAGFIAADGNIKKNRNCLRIGLSIKDIDFLSNLSSKFTSHPLRISNKYATATLEIHSEKIVQDLRLNFNIVPAKTLIIKPPSISEINSLAYILGYIDGDGCIGTYKLSSGKTIFSIQILGTKLILEWILSLFNNFVDTSTVNLYNRNKIYSITLASNKAKIVCDVLRSLPLPKMHRKWYDEPTLDFNGD